MADDVSTSGRRHSSSSVASSSSQSGNSTMSDGPMDSLMQDVILTRLTDKLRTPTADQYVVDRPLSDVDRSVPSTSTAADLLVSLFMSALTSYRRDTVLRPFPQAYVHHVAKDFRQLKSVADEIPALAALLHRASSPPTTSDFSNPLPRDEVLCLLDWILDTKNLSLERISTTTSFAEIKRLTGQVMDTLCPTYIFEVHHSHVGCTAAVDEKFGWCDGEDLVYAFHGSRLENFHSILRNGLRNHMNKNSVFGEGTYLSSELSVCIAYSPTGRGWRKSVFGDKLSCVAVCQLIRHPDVKCHTRYATNDSPSNLLVRTGDRATENIPEKYYLVQNDELVRVKYLLVYTDRPAIRTDRNLTSNVRRPRSSWLFRNRFLLMLLAYVVVLLAIGLSSSSSFRSVSRRFTL